MPKKINSKILQTEIKDKIRNFYPYFLGFYLLSVIIAIFYKAWSYLFYWPAFNGAIIFFTLIFLFTFKFSLNELKKQLIKLGYFIHTKLTSLSRRTWLKIFTIIIILIFAIFKEINIFDFLVLIYALISVLFKLDSRYAAGAALFFLATCPFLLIFKKDLLAESVAIYAYYFLVITVITQIRELTKEEKNVDNLKNKKSFFA